MNTLKVDIPGHEYDINIASDSLNNAGRLIGTIYNGTKIGIVTDENVWKIYGQRFTDILNAEGFVFEPVVMRPGEESKSLKGLEMVYNAFAKMGLHRDNLAIAFGGGVIGDLCGYAAATYMRGMDFIQIPTTLLAQVDSSIGGKTAINLDCGKNMAGVFAQPKMVIIDPTLTDSLSNRDYRGGMAELIKHGVIFSRELFGRLNDICENSRLSKEHAADVIYKSCNLKRVIVERDQFDRGERMLLNFGHSFAHAIETKFNYERYTHGEAVALGMIFAARAGELLGLTECGCEMIISDLLIKYGFETKIDFKAGELTEFMRTDKKNDEKFVKLIMIRKIGDSFIHKIGISEFFSLMKELD